MVIVEPDEVKTKAQPSTGRKEIWTYTAVLLVAGLRYAVGGRDDRGAVVAGLGAAARAGCGQRRPSAPGTGRRGVVDPDVVRELGDRSARR